MYLNGYGVNKDLKKAAYWVRKARDSGDRQAHAVWEENELWKYQ